MGGQQVCCVTHVHPKKTHRPEKPGFDHVVVHLFRKRTGEIGRDNGDRISFLKLGRTTNRRKGA